MKENLHYGIDLHQKEKPREECGIFGIYFPHPDFGEKTAIDLITGLHVNQHRGEESAGIVVAGRKHMSEPFKRMGLVKVLKDAYEHAPIEVKNDLNGTIGIGHNRYSTTGSSNIENAAPFKFVSPDLGPVALAHNGNITNADQFRKELCKKGYQFTSTTDSEVIGNLILDSKGANWDEKITKTLKKLEGSFNLVLCTRNALYGARDSLGNRPVSFAEFEKDGVKGYAISSESPAFDDLGIIYQRELKPGELIKFNQDGVNSSMFEEKTNPAFCGLEIAYLMRPDSRIEKVQLDTIRRNLGEKLAQSQPPPEDIDYITYIPESSRQSAEGYSEKSSQLLERNVPVRTSMIKGRYGSVNGSIRGFINPDNNQRESIGKSNYYVMDWVIGKKIVVVDDSIIRGNTTRGVVNTLKQYVGDMKNSGAKEIHLRIIFPKVKYPCPLGTDINDKDFLVAREIETVDKIAGYLGSDTLGYLSIEEYQSMVNTVMGKEYPLCLGCTNGRYPIQSYNTNKELFEER